MAYVAILIQCPFLRGFFAKRNNIIPMPNKIPWNRNNTDHGLKNLGFLKKIFKFLEFLNSF